MHWFQAAFDFLRVQPSKPRRGPARRNRLGFESLEAREVFSAASISPASLNTAPVLNLVDNTLNSAGGLTYTPSQIHVAIYGQQYETKQ